MSGCVESGLGQKGPKCPVSIGPSIRRFVDSRAFRTVFNDEILSILYMNGKRAGSLRLLSDAQCAGTFLPFERFKSHGDLISSLPAVFGSSPASRNVARLWRNAPQTDMKR